MGDIDINKADLYALREFLVRYCADKSERYAPPNEIRVFSDYYLFTCVNFKNGNPFFCLRRAKLFHLYDIVEFSYSDSKIQLEKKDIQDNSDIEQVNSLISILRDRYSKIMPSLEKLL